MAPRPERAEVERHLQALPLVEGAVEEVILNDKASQAAISDLKRHSSRIPDHARAQAAAVTAEEFPDLETTDDGEHVIVDRETIQSIATKAALRGATQAIYDVGHVLLEARQLEDMLQTEEPPELPPAHI